MNNIAMRIENEGKGEFSSMAMQLWADGALDEALNIMENADEANVISTLDQMPLTSDEFITLLSPIADNFRQQIEETAKELTRLRFGKTVNLYIPLYLSNHCINNCSYCWFGTDQNFERKVLSIQEAREEAKLLYRVGYRNILLVAGEDPKATSVEYLAEMILLMKEIGFVFVAIETQIFSTDEYSKLGAAGLDSVTVYQETYDPILYSKAHPSGPKRDYMWRINAPDRIAQAGIRGVSVGVLLGLGDFRREAITLATHIKHLNKAHWQTSVSASFPRIHSAPNGFSSEHAVSDTELVRLILAMRLTFPDSTLAISTRETPKLRDQLFGMGINQASAGSRTSPGGYSGGGAGEQFPVADDRTPMEVASAIQDKGLEWVFKDWDINFKPIK
ncbi:MAG TPA: 2-iminoacetate synthase ThiH [Nitrospinota bacterium]|nr:2-iminoacetate synthase ThiH [Nitrospinota bacterium]